jgi:hypothetical protein
MELPATPLSRCHETGGFASPPCDGFARHHRYRSCGRGRCAYIRSKPRNAQETKCLNETTLRFGDSVQSIQKGGWRWKVRKTNLVGAVASVRVLTHIKKMEDCFAQFPGARQL